MTADAIPLVYHRGRLVGQYLREESFAFAQDTSYPFTTTLVYVLGRDGQVSSYDSAEVTVR